MGYKRIPKLEALKQINIDKLSERARSGSVLSNVVDYLKKRKQSPTGTVPIQDITYYSWANSLNNVAETDHKESKSFRDMGVSGTDKFFLNEIMFYMAGLDKRISEVKAFFAPYSSSNGMMKVQDEFISYLEDCYYNLKTTNVDTKMDWLRKKFKFLGDARIKPLIDSGIMDITNYAIHFAHTEDYATYEKFLLSEAERIKKDENLQRKTQILHEYDGDMKKLGINKDQFHKYLNDPAVTPDEFKSKIQATINQKRQELEKIERQKKQNYYNSMIEAGNKFKKDQSEAIENKIADSTSFDEFKDIVDKYIELNARLKQEKLNYVEQCGFDQNIDPLSGQDFYNNGDI